MRLTPGWQAGRQAGWQAGRQAGWQAGRLAGSNVRKGWGRLSVTNTKLFMEQNALKIVNNCWNTTNNTFYSFSE
jgi:hypothetical protein